MQEIAGELAFIQERFFKRSSAELVRLAEEIADSFRNGSRLLTFGTGTSGAVAQILSTAFTWRVAVSRPPLPALALTTHGPLIGALAEDLGAEQIFSRQIEAVGRKGDLALAISADGDSPAALRGLVAAREMGLTTAALLGKDGGRMKNYTGVTLVVESARLARVHEVHLVAVHVLAQLVERILFPL